MRSKSIFKSKTFYLNLVGLALAMVPSLPLDPETIGFVMGWLNIANRAFTDKPVHVL
jgi:hypothetical protein